MSDLPPKWPNARLTLPGDLFFEVHLFSWTWKNTC